MFKFTIGIAAVCMVVVMVSIAFSLAKAPSKVADVRYIERPYQLIPRITPPKIVVLQLKGKRYRLDTYPELLAYYNCDRGVYLKLASGNVQKVTASYCKGSNKVAKFQAPGTNLIRATSGFHGEGSAVSGTLRKNY